MKNRREIVRAALASPAFPGRTPRASGTHGIREICKRDQPQLTLEDWEVAVVELTFPPGGSSVKHEHPGTVIGYVLEGAFTFQREGQRAVVVSRGEVFFEPVGAVHSRGESANVTKPAKVVALVFGKKSGSLTTGS